MSKEESIQISLSREALREIEFAAQWSGGCVESFVLSSGLEAAREMVEPENVFVLSKEEYDAFAEQIKKPADKSKLEEFLAIPTPWEESSHN